MAAKYNETDVCKYVNNQNLAFSMDEYCSAYQNGYCKYGNNCKFLHEIDLKSYDGNNNSLDKFKKNKDKFHKMGFIQKSDRSSNNNHEDVSALPRELKTKEIPYQLKTNQCHYYQNGYCARGNSCKYSHILDRNSNRKQSSSLFYGTEGHQDLIMNNAAENINLADKTEVNFQNQIQQSTIELNTNSKPYKSQNIERSSRYENTESSYDNNPNSYKNNRNSHSNKKNEHFPYNNHSKIPSRKIKKGACYSFIKTGHCPNGDYCNFYHHYANTNSFNENNSDILVENKKNSKETLNKSLCDDTASDTYCSGKSSALDIPQHDATSFLLCCPSKFSEHSCIHLKEYAVKNRLNIVEMFYNEKLKMEEKRENVFKNDFSTYKEENEAIYNEEKLLVRQEMSFNTEIKRISSIPVTIKNEHFLKSAFDREFRRAVQKLPIYGYREEILDKLNNHNVLVLVGLTGSGKSTQVVQYLLEAGFDRGRKICCTEPRKVACVSLAKRISEEMMVPEDTLVTYKIGKNKNASNVYDKQRNKINEKSNLVLMTDKILLNEYLRDNKLRKYSCILIDEAHERSISSDLLLCELKKLIEKRKGDKYPLKLIIMSATIDYDKFSKYFDNCPTIHVSGYLYPVIINYEKMKQNYWEQIVDKIKQIVMNKSENPGDVLVFLTSFEEIIAAKRKVEKFMEDTNESENYICLSLYGRMEVEEQSKVFLSHNNKTKIIFSTNVAETSITIDGVKVVIDSGRCKERVFDQGSNISLIKLSTISQSSAIQRKGRAGRTSNGICYRLYEESDFNQMEVMIQPEIFRLNLGLVMLQLLAFNVENPLNYDLIDKPDENLMAFALQKLIDLRFVDDNKKISETGRIATELGQEPTISRFIIEGVNLGIPYEITIIASMISVSNILYSRASTKEEKNIGTLKCSNTNGDLLTMLDMFKTYRSFKSYPEKLKWCNSLFLSINAFKQAEQTLGDLWSIIKKTSYFRNYSGPRIDNENEIKILVLNAICTSMHSNLAYFNGHSNGLKIYKLVELNQEAYMHPSSSLYVLQEPDVHADLVVFADILRTDKLYIKNITPVSTEMIKKYTSFNLDGLQLQIKQQINIEVNPTIIDSLKSTNSNLIEHLEASVGCVINLKSSSIMIEVTNINKEKSFKIVKDFVEMVKDRLINEMYEYRPESYDNVKLIIGKGLKTHAILLNREYLRLNLFDIDTKITQNEILEKFQKFGIVLVARINKATSSRSTGYVTMSDIKSAQDAFNHFSVNCTEFNVIPSASIESNAKFSKVPLLKASWFLTPPNGRAFLTFKTNDDLNLAERVLTNAGYRVSQSNSNPQLELMVSNVTEKDSQMDEIKFKKYLSAFSKIENCVFLRHPVPSSNDLMIQNGLVNSLFSKYGEIDSIFILNSSISKDKDGLQLKPRVDAHIKFKEYQSAINAYKGLDNTTGKISNFGLFHVRVNYREEIKVPGDVYTHFSKEINQIQDIIREELNCKTVFNEINESKNKAYLIVITGDEYEKIKEAYKALNQLLEPEVLTLQYFKYDKIRKKLNKENYQSIFQTEFNILITKDARYNQLKIYGKQRQKASEELLKGLSDSESDSITINVKSFKSIIGSSSDHLKLLKDEFRGEIKCDFKKKTITLFSKLENLKKFEAKVQQLDRDYSSKSISKSSQDNYCNICLTECETPFRLLQCNHLFCFECIRAQIFNFDMISTLECAADGCTMLLTIPDIKKVVGYNSKIIDQKCHFSMNNYLLHSKEYKSCKNCDDLCRIEREKSIYFCDRCNKTYCSICCNLEHDGYPCNDKGKELFDKYFKANAKSCPKCSTPIEKNAGCNHMTCFVCRTHFCWLCLQTTENETKMYDHLRSSHGGIDTA